VHAEAGFFFEVRFTQPTPTSDLRKPNKSHVEWSFVAYCTDIAACSEWRWKLESVVGSVRDGSFDTTRAGGVSRATLRRRAEKRTRSLLSGNFSFVHCAAPSDVLPRAVMLHTLAACLKEAVEPWLLKDWPVPLKRPRFVAKRLLAGTDLLRLLFGMQPGLKHPSRASDLRFLQRSLEDLGVLARVRGGADLADLSRSVLADEARMRRNAGGHGDPPGDPPWRGKTVPVGASDGASDWTDDGTADGFTPPRRVPGPSTVSPRQGGSPPPSPGGSPASASTARRRGSYRRSTLASW
jgi:hypothetical protein